MHETQLGGGACGELAGAAAGAGTYYVLVGLIEEDGVVCLHSQLSAGDSFEMVVSIVAHTGMLVYLR